MFGADTLTVIVEDVTSRLLGHDVASDRVTTLTSTMTTGSTSFDVADENIMCRGVAELSLIHISEPTRPY